MEVEFLGQGYNQNSTKTVESTLETLFNDSHFDKFTCISAFTSEKAIKTLEGFFGKTKSSLKKTIVTGIHNKVTTKEALDKLLKLDINSYVYFFIEPYGSVFHPKIYLFEGKEKSALILGSSNLTSGGLSSNVEASLFLKIDNSIEADKKLIDAIQSHYTGILSKGTNKNLCKLEQPLIDGLVNHKLVYTIAERDEKKEKERKEEKNEVDDDTKDYIRRLFPPLSKSNFESSSNQKGKGTKKENLQNEPIQFFLKKSGDDFILSINGSDDTVINKNNIQILIDELMPKHTIGVPKLVMLAILQHQWEYFQKGDEGKLKPLTQKRLAKIIDRDNGRISHIVDNLIETHFGEFILGKIFSEHIFKKGNEEFSREHIEELIKGFIEAEPRKEPLDDDALTINLQTDGFDIKRRTVVKYRAEMEILNSNQRRRLYILIEKENKNNPYTDEQLFEFIKPKSIQMIIKTRELKGI